MNDKHIQNTKDNVIKCSRSTFLCLSIFTFNLEGTHLTFLRSKGVSNHFIRMVCGYIILMVIRVTILLNRLGQPEDRHCRVTFKASSTSTLVYTSISNLIYV